MAPLVDADFVVRRVRARASEVVFIKAVIEASEGLGTVFAERGGDLTLAAHRSRAHDLDELILDLVQENLLHVQPES